MESREFEKLEALLYKEADKIKPPESNLKAVLSRLQEPVTENNLFRYSYTRTKKGRALDNLKNELDKIMNNFWKIALPVGAIVLVIAAVGYFKLTGIPLGERGIYQFGAGKSASQPTEFASAEINQAINNLSDSVADDDLYAEMEAEDAAYINYDDKALSNYDNISLVYE